MRRLIVLPILVPLFAPASTSDAAQCTTRNEARSVCKVLRRRIACNQCAFRSAPSGSCLRPPAPSACAGTIVDDAVALTFGDNLLPAHTSTAARSGASGAARSRSARRSASSSASSATTGRKRERRAHGIQLRRLASPGVYRRLRVRASQHGLAITEVRAIRKRDSYLAAQYRRLVKRRGDKKAVIAVAHSILIIAYTSCGTGSPIANLAAPTSTT